MYKFLHTQKTTDKKRVNSLISEASKYNRISSVYERIYLLWNFSFSGDGEQRHFPGRLPAKIFSTMMDLSGAVNKIQEVMPADPCILYIKPNPSVFLRASITFRQTVIILHSRAFASEDPDWRFNIDIFSLYQSVYRANMPILSSRVNFFLL